MMSSGFDAMLQRYPMDDDATEPRETTRPPWWANTRGEFWVAGQVTAMGATAFAPFVPFPVSLPATGRLVGFGLMVVGALIGAWGMLALGPSLAAVPRPVSRGRLVTDGPYAFVRHPIYAGVSLAGLGWALTTRSVPTLVAALATVAYLHRKAVREEVWLRRTYADYGVYVGRVRRLVPFVW